ncbi:hypothetical protein JKP88DRAFT_320131 [Tribonema minus]|uniref:Right handed beta helix domain-containing protein n=1 Tax=Tribonema minus TaxID=303371 RepID=A0A835YUK8_9STRA|nr:hypothetical protein JKP88DRAFT_320131 [Tribonema minus]
MARSNGALHLRAHELVAGTKRFRRQHLDTVELHDAVAVHQDIARRGSRSARDRARASTVIEFAVLVVATPRCQTAPDMRVAVVAIQLRSLYTRVAAAREARAESVQPSDAHAFPRSQLRVYDEADDGHRTCTQFVDAVGQRGSGYWDDVIGACIQNPGDIVSVVNETNGTRTFYAGDTLERHFKAQITQRVATMYDLEGMQVVGPGRETMSWPQLGALGVQYTPSAAELEGIHSVYGQLQGKLSPQLVQEKLEELQSLAPSPEESTRGAHCRAYTDSYPPASVFRVTFVLRASRTFSARADPHECQKAFRHFVVDGPESAGALTTAAACPDATINVTWRGDVTIRQQIVVGNGTALRMSGSTPASVMRGVGGNRLMAVSTRANVTLDSMHLMNGNYTRGGAVLVGKSGHLTLQSCLLTNNTADSDGGAIYNQGGVVVARESTFIDNYADYSSGSGGAIYNQYGNMILLKSTFRTNTAAFGGAIDIEAGTAIVRASTFSGNRAKYSGGAVVTHNDAFFAESTFADNLAGAAGGGLFVEGGMLTMADSNVINNKAGRGAAIAITTGTLKVTNSRFTGNAAASAGGGGAILQVGEYDALTIAVADSVFQGNSAQCCYAGGIHTGVGSSCVDANSGYGLNWPCCSTGMYSGTDAIGPACVACTMDAVNCTAVGATLPTLPLSSGYWRENDTMVPSNVRACPNRHACEGGIGVSSVGVWIQEVGMGSPGWSSDAYCAAGYQGPYCAVCADGYAAVTGYKCVKCTAGVASAVVVGVVVLFAAVGLGLWILFAAALGLGEGADATSTFAAASGTLKLSRGCVILARHLRTSVIVMQILTQFVSITGVALPLQYLDFLQVMDLISLDLRWLTSPGCVLHLSFYQRLVLTTLVPLGIAGVILAPRAYRRCRPRSAGAKLQRVCEQDLHVLLVFAFLVYSGVSLTIFQTFACDYLEYDGPDGTWYLRADYTIQCRTPEHAAYVTYAAIMLLVYPLGIPAIFAWLIRLGAADVRERSALASATSFLRKPYSPQTPYWECAECLRRLLLAGLLFFIMPGTAGQTAVACVFASLAGLRICSTSRGGW